MSNRSEPLLNRGLSRRSAMAGLISAAAAPALAQAPASPWSNVEQLAGDVIAARAAPGIQLCVRRGGQDVYSRGFGSANLEHGTAMTPASICRVASITKEFTAALVLLLIQDGVLKLDDPLSKHLPSFPQARRVTLRHLLNHTSGYWNYTDVADPRQLLNLASQDRTAEEFISMLSAPKRVLTFEPGARWAYSNTNYFLLSAVLEKASGRSYAELLEDRITAPLGLTHTAIDERADVIRGRVHGYLIDAKSASGFRNNRLVSASWARGSGNLRSTAEELCAWHEALLVTRKVLKPETVEAMIAPAQLADGSPAKYGLGMMIGENQGRRYFFHNGSTVGFQTEVMTLPGSGTSIAYIFNTDFGDAAPEPQAAALINRFRYAVLMSAMARPS